MAYQPLWVNSNSILVEEQLNYLNLSWRDKGFIILSRVFIANLKHTPSMLNTYLPNEEVIVRRLNSRYITIGYQKNFLF